MSIKRRRMNEGGLFEERSEDTREENEDAVGEKTGDAV